MASASAADTSGAASSEPTTQQNKDATTDGFKTTAAQDNLLKTLEVDRSVLRPAAWEPLSVPPDFKAATKLEMDWAPSTRPAVDEVNKALVAMMPDVQWQTLVEDWKKAVVLPSVDTVLADMRVIGMENLPLLPGLRVGHGGLLLVERKETCGLSYILHLCIPQRKDSVKAVDIFKVTEHIDTTYDRDPNSPARKTQKTKNLQADGHFQAERWISEATVSLKVDGNIFFAMCESTLSGKAKMHLKLKQTLTYDETQALRAGTPDQYVPGSAGSIECDAPTCLMAGATCGCSLLALKCCPNCDWGYWCCCLNTCGLSLCCPCCKDLRCPGCADCLKCDFSKCGCKDCDFPTCAMCVCTLGCSLLVPKCCPACADCCKCGCCPSCNPKCCCLCVSTLGCSLLCNPECKCTGGSIKRTPPTAGYTIKGTPGDPLGKDSKETFTTTVENTEELLNKMYLESYLFDHHIEDKTMLLEPPAHATTRTPMPAKVKENVLSMQRHILHLGYRGLHNNEATLGCVYLAAKQDRHQMQKVMSLLASHQVPLPAGAKLEVREQPQAFAAPQQVHMLSKLNLGWGSTLLQVNAKPEEEEEKEDLAVAAEPKEKLPELVESSV